MLLLRNLAYNSSQRQAAAGGSGSGDALQGWSGGEVLAAVKAVLQRPQPSTAVSGEWEGEEGEGAGA